MEAVTQIFNDTEKSQEESEPSKKDKTEKYAQSTQYIDLLKDIIKQIESDDKKGLTYIITELISGTEKKVADLTSDLTKINSIVNELSIKNISTQEDESPQAEAEQEPQVEEAEEVVPKAEPEEEEVDPKVEEEDESPPPEEEKEKRRRKKEEEEGKKGGFRHHSRKTKRKRVTAGIKKKRKKRGSKKRGSRKKAKQIKSK